MMILSLFSTGPLPAATIGTRATFSNDFHNVSGTATVLDLDRLRIDDFTYDGQGLDVFFYLGAQDSAASFFGGLSVGDQLLGTVFDGTQAPIIVQLPAGQSLDDYGAISVWCVDAAVSFGSGSFVSVPEPSAAGLVLVAGAAIGLSMRRR